VTATPDTEWRQPIGLKPSGRGDFGYVDSKGLHNATREEIAALLSSGRYDGRILVWTPESPHVITSAESSIFRAAFQEGLRRRAFRWKPRGGPLALIIFGAVTAALFGLSALGKADPDQTKYVTIGVVMMIAGIVGELRPRYGDYIDSRLDADGLVAGESAASRHATWVERKSTGDSSLFTIVLIIVFLAQLPWRDVSFAAAAFNAVAIKSGEWWRLFTSPMMHAHYLHIGANMSAIVFAGERIEAHLHRAFVPLVFLVGALYGGLASLLVMHTDRPMVGASGGAIALVGFLLVFARRRQKYLPPGFGRSLMVGLMLTAIIGVVGYQFIGNAAHVGGLLAGVLMGLLVIPRDANVPASKAVIAAGIGAAGILVLSAVGAIVVILRAAL
jgi:rhomboid protease GluP